MRWELRDPWSDAVYCCVACYDSGGQEHDEWDTAYSSARLCTSDWPDRVLEALFGPPPPPHQHAGPIDRPVTSTHLAAHMDDAAEPDNDGGDGGYQLAELIFDTLRTATRHANAPTVVLITVLHLLQAQSLAAAVEAHVAGLQAAMDAAPAPGTHTTPPDSPAAQDQPQPPAPPHPPLDDQHHPTGATPTGQRLPPPF